MSSLSAIRLNRQDDESTDDEEPGVVGGGEDNSVVSAGPFAGAAPGGPSIFDTATQERDAGEENTTSAVPPPAAATTDLGGRVQLPPDPDESRVGDVRQPDSREVAAPSTIMRGIEAEGGLGAHGEAGAAAAAPLCPSRPVDLALGRGDGSDRGGLADGQSEGPGLLSAADEPSWALAPTQPPPQQDPSSPSLAPASSLSNHGGASDGARRRTVGGGSSQVQSRTGVEAAASVASVAVGHGGRGDAPSQRFLWAPAAQEPFGISDYDDVTGMREEGEEHEAEEENRVEVKEEHVEETGDGSALEEAQPDSTVNSSLDLDIPESDGEDDNNGVAAAGTDILRQTEDVPVVNNDAATGPVRAY